MAISAALPLDATRSASCSRL